MDETSLHDCPISEVHILALIGGLGGEIMCYIILVLPLYNRSKVLYNKLMLKTPHVNDKIWATLFMEDLWQFHYPTANQAN